MSESPELKELTAIRKLLMLLCAKSKATSDEIGRTLGIDSGTVRHMIPMTGKRKSKGD